MGAMPPGDFGGILAQLLGGALPPGVTIAAGPGGPPPPPGAGAAGAGAGPAAGASGTGADGPGGPQHAQQPGGAFCCTAAEDAFSSDSLVLLSVVSKDLHCHHLRALRAAGIRQ